MKLVDITTLKRLGTSPVNWSLNPLAKYASRSKNISGARTCYFRLLTEFDCFEIFSADTKDQTNVCPDKNFFLDFVETILVLSASADRP